MSAGVWCTYAWNVCMKANSDVWKHIKVLSAQRGKTQYNFQVQTFSSYPATPCANTHGIMRYHLIFFKSSEKTKLLCTDVHTQRINGELLTEKLHSCLLLARYHQGGKAVLEHTKFKLPIPKALTSKCRRALNSFCKLLPQQVCKGFTTFQWGSLRTNSKLWACSYVSAVKPFRGNWGYRHTIFGRQFKLSLKLKLSWQTGNCHRSCMHSRSCVNLFLTARGHEFYNLVMLGKERGKKNLFVPDVFIVVKLSTAKYM